MMIEFSQFSLTQKGKQHANLMRNLTVHRRKSEIRNLEEIRNHLPLYKCLVSPLYWHLWSWKEAKKEQIHGQLSQQFFFFSWDRKCTYSFISLNIFTWSLSDLRKRRPGRLPSGIRTRRVTAFSLSFAGSFESEASFAASILSSSCHQKEREIWTA